MEVIRKAKREKTPLYYDHTTDGNVFNWILLKAETVRQLRRIQKDAAEKAAKESESLD